MLKYRVTMKVDTILWDLPNGLPPMFPSRTLLFDWKRTVNNSKPQKCSTKRLSSSNILTSWASSHDLTFHLHCMLSICRCVFCCCLFIVFTYFLCKTRFYLTQTMTILFVFICFYKTTKQRKKEMAERKTFQGNFIYKTRKYIIKLRSN